MIGSSTVTLNAGQSETVKVSLNSAGKKLQAQHKKLTASLQITSAGQTLKSQNITITQTTLRRSMEDAGQAIRMYTRTTLPVGVERICTRSHS